MKFSVKDCRKSRIRNESSPMISNLSLASFVEILNILHKISISDRNNRKVSGLLLEDHQNFQKKVSLHKNTVQLENIDKIKMHLLAFRFSLLVNAI